MDASRFAGQNKATSSEQQVTDRQAATSVILLVEDDPLVAEACAMLLEDLGYLVIRAASADDALNVLGQGTRPDLVFSDVMMPGSLDGVELARTLRARYPNMPIVLTTGFSKAAASAMASGFTLLLKPYLPNDLERTIKTALLQGTRT